MRKKQNTNDRILVTLLTVRHNNTCTHIDTHTHILGKQGHILQELELLVFEFQKRNM